MTTRRIDASELARLIADRAVREGQTEARIMPQALIGHFTETAVKLLRKGQRYAAAAIFEAAKELTPRSAEAHNNYGFCILPDRPEEALIALVVAADLLGSDTWAVNVGNRLLALRKLGRLTTALELAERFIAAAPSVEPNSAYMWSFETNEAELLLVDDVRMYALGLAVKIAADTGDELLTTRWQRKVEELKSALS